MTVEGLSLVDGFRSAARLFADQAAIAFMGRHTSFAELNRQSDRVAVFLLQRSIQKGDRVALYCINSDFFPAAYFGILKAGAVVVPINLLLNPKEIAYILNDARVRGLIYFEAFHEAVRAFQTVLPTLEFSVAIGTQRAQESDIPWADVMKTPVQTPPTPAFNPAEDLAVLIYTSGTTGHPKGAMLTHRNLMSNQWSVTRMLGLVPGREKFLVVLPMFHAFAGTACMLVPLLQGCTIVPLPKFDPVQVAQAVEQEHVTLFLGVPSMYNVLLHAPDELLPKFQSLRYCISGGAAMPMELMKKFEARFGKLIYEGDGPTECSPVTCVNPIGGVRKHASVGLPVPDVEMKILDEDGREVPVTQPGEICVRGPNVMKGYWNQPEETQKSFFGEWFRTGDIGTMDADGYFYIVDRKKDMVIVNGMNVYPRVVEEILYQHPAVREAAVIGEPDELHGEIPVAYISLKPGLQAKASEIRAFCRDSLGRHEVPRKVFFIPDLPKNAAGKILKRELRKQGELERGVDSRKPE